MMEEIVLIIVAAIITACNIHVMMSNVTIMIGGGGEDDAMSHSLHAACNLCNVAVVSEIACNNLEIRRINRYWEASYQ